MGAGAFPIERPRWLRSWWCWRSAGAVVATLSPAVATRERIEGEVWCNQYWYSRKAGRAGCWKSFTDPLLAPGEEIEAAGIDLAARISKFNPSSAATLSWLSGTHRGRRGDQERECWGRWEGFCHLYGCSGSGIGVGCRFGGFTWAGAGRLRAFWALRMGLVRGFWCVLAIQSRCSGRFLG